MKNAKYIILIGVFFTSLSSIIVRQSISPPLVISFYRMLFSVLMLIVPVIGKYRKKLLNIKRTDFILCVFSGIFLALHFSFWIASINMTSIVNSTVLVSCSPIFVAVISFFLLKERLNFKIIISICVTFIGTLIVAKDGSLQTDSISNLGNLFAFLGGIFVAFYLVLGNICRKNIEAMPYVFIVYTVSSIVLFLFCLGTQAPLYPYSLKEMFLFIALAFFCSILGHTIYNWVIPYVSATFVSSAILLEPVFASTIAIFAFNETPSIGALIGGAVIIIGIIMFIRFKNCDS